jgi:division protein CdvB (Snf7/Vps24/ESCRT-III family)
VDLEKEAIKAIMKVLEDTSVSKDTTRDRLNRISEEIDELVNTLQD